MQKQELGWSNSLGALFLRFDLFLYTTGLLPCNSPPLEFI